MAEGLITAEDTVYGILTRFPGLRDILISSSPKFIRLQNPVLFNTVARFTTLQKAAATAKLYLNDLLYNLNEAIGKGEEYLRIKKAEIASGKDKYMSEHKPFSAKERPSWAGLVPGFEVLDLRIMKEEPFFAVKTKTEGLLSGQGLTLVQKFEPLPLIEWLERNGFRTWSEQNGDEEYRIHFYKT